MLLKDYAFLLGITLVNLGCVLTQSSSQVGHIVHRASGKLIHPLGGKAIPADNTRLMVHEGGLKETRLQIKFDKDPAQNGYGYIRHVSSGKYVHPMGGSLQPADDTLLVFHRGKHAACLFKFDMDYDYIIQQSSNKIWHPKGGKRHPPNNNLVVLHRARHDRATFFFANDCGAKIFDIIMFSPVGHIVHLSSRKLIHPLGRKAQLDDKNKQLIVNTAGFEQTRNPIQFQETPEYDYTKDTDNLILNTGGFGQTRLHMQFEEAPDQSGYGYIKHVPSNRYVHPLCGSLKPVDDTPLVYHRGKHAACLFKFDKCNDYIIQKSSQKIWSPKCGRSIPADNTMVVVHGTRHNNAKFYFSDNTGAKVFP